MHRIALGLEYDGAEFHGWQCQPSLITVQSTLENALTSVANEPIKTTCAGRTDAGVHATYQVVHFDTQSNRRERGWVLGTNTYLPPSIRVLWVKNVPFSFDARKTAIARHYRYIIYNHSIRPSLCRHYLSWCYKKLTLDSMISAANHWIGQHDFSAFRAAECQSKTAIRSMYSIDIIQQGNYFILDFIANAFLHHMVRNMVGALIAIGSGEKNPVWAKEILMGRDRRLAGVTAHPQGLYLIDVHYPPSFNIPLSSHIPPIPPFKGGELKETSPQPPFKGGELKGIIE